jgi:hypothetical protein
VWHIDGRPVTLSDPAVAGEPLSLLATGLGPTNPTVPTGAVAPVNPPAAVATIPSVTVDGLTAPVQYAGLEPSTVGKYRVFFSVPSSLSAGNHSLSLRIANQSSNSVILQMAGQGFPSISSLVNGASHSLASIASPGSIVTLFGSNFGQQDNFSAFPATSVDGTVVRFNGTRAPIGGIQAQVIFSGLVPGNAGIYQVNFQVPDGVPFGDEVPIVVTALNGLSDTATFAVNPLNE